MTCMFQSTNRFSISMAVAVFFLSYCLIILLPGSSPPLRDGDTFWHIRTGQWILANAKFPVVDFYSYTAVGKRWISGEWLSEIFFAFAFKIGEWRGVVILSAIAWAAIIAIFCLYLLRNLRFSVAIGWTAITVLAISPHYLARPHVFSYILMLIWLIILLDAYDERDFKPSPVVLTILMILWANLHGSFTLGLVFLYVFAGVACYNRIIQREYFKCKQTLFMLLAVSVGALLTPYGVYSALLTLEVANLKYTLQHTSEWQSPDFQSYQPLLFLFVGLFAAVTGLGVRLRGPRLIVLSLMMLLGLSHIRGLIMFFLSAPVILARPVLARSSWWGAAQHTQTQSSEAASASDPVLVYLQKRPIMLPAICLAAAALVTAFSWRHIDIGPPKSITPRAAVDFVRNAGITGNVFNDYVFAGYLIFSGIPTFIDSRVPLYTDDFVRKYDEAVNLVDINNSFHLLDEYKVSWVILVPVEPLAKALAQNAQWVEVYSDEYSVVFLRRR
jgi:hypothetical protein